MLYSSEFCKQEFHHWNDTAKKLAVGGQEYGIDGRTMKRVSLDHAQNQMKYWKKEYYSCLAKEKKGGRRSITQVIPKDF